MKKIVLVTLLLGAIGASAGAERPRLDGHESPRATDLLRAETLAEQAERRLKAPPRHGPAWRHGGSGWDDDGGAAPASRDSVIIHLHPSRRRAPRP